MSESDVVWPIYAPVWVVVGLAFSLLWVEMCIAFLAFRVRFGDVGHRSRGYFLKGQRAQEELRLPYISWAHREKWSGGSGSCILSSLVEPCRASS